MTIVTAKYAKITRLLPSCSPCVLDHFVSMGIVIPFFHHQVDLCYTGKRQFKHV